MRNFTFLVCFLLGIATSEMLFSQENAKSETAQTKQDLAEQLLESPDDTALFNKYMIQQLRPLRGLIKSDPDKAEKVLQEMRELVESLKPEKPAGKQLVRRALQSIEGQVQQLELERVTIEELVGKLKSDPNDAKALSLYAAKFAREVTPMTRTEPEAAEQMLNSAKEMLAAVSEKADEDSQPLIARVLGSFSGIEKRIELGKRLAALVGSDAAPIEIEDWVNGDALSADDLKGKVVLLDFWAVWCGPCIATFPHLREWHEKYSDKGLEIIGLTRYYQFTWDEEAERAKRADKEDEVTPEQEQEMLATFAKHHDLHHRFAIQKDSTLSNHYAVSGIPHVVVIDREGKVRLFTIGSGAKNAKDISDLMEKLFSESE